MLDNKLSTGVFVLGLLFFISSFFGVFTPSSSSRVEYELGMAERRLAIKNAKENNQKTYSFSTSFTPGIGYISDPDVYKKQWEADAKKALEDSRSKTE